MSKPDVVPALPEWPLCELAEQYSACGTALVWLIAMAAQRLETAGGTALQGDLQYFLDQLDRAAWFYDQAISRRLRRAIREERAQQRGITDEEEG